MPNDTPNPRGPNAVTHQLPAGELPPGWTLLGGQYEIVRLIASGGFGITYLAKDTLGRDVAVKECFPLGLAQRQAATHAVSATSAGTSEHFETARAQFLREARMLAALRHPNVVHVQTLFEENGTAYMAMDFIHGRDLQEEIVGADGGMSAPRVLELARDLLGALDYVHGQGVLHRDIKPQNIRIDQFGMPMLIDFGAARAETQARSRMAGTFRVVTDGYSPHEFYVSGAPQGPHSDLYALAATLHHVITGAAPVAADERASAIATGNADPYRSIADKHPEHDGRLLHLIDRALRMTPADRPDNAAAWLNTLTDAPTTLVAPVATAEPAPPRPSRLVPGLLVGALLATGAGAGIYMAQPAWLSPGMGEMMERMGQLEVSLAEAEAARADAESELVTLRGTLQAAEEELARLEAADGDMAATMAELEVARSARDAAAAQVAGLEQVVADLTATQQALEEARAERDAAEARAEAAEAARAEAEASAATLQENLAAATAELETAAAQAATLAQVEADLTEAEAALYAASSRASALEAQLQLALDGEVDADALRQQLLELQRTMTEMEIERDRLLEEIEAASASTESNAGEVERLRTRVAELEAENDDLRAALTRAETALGQSGGPIWSPGDPDPWVEGARISAPNGTMALLPRFSWDHARVALADSTGGIALFDRDTGAYEAHLARGIPTEITRLGFSSGGNYLIATTPNGTPNRLYHIPTRREVLRFEPTTVTTSNRAISRDESHFIYTRAASGGQTEIVSIDLAVLRAAAPGTSAPGERVLDTVAANSGIRISFAETSNRITLITTDTVRIYAPDGTLLANTPNRMGVAAAISPLADDRGLLVLRGTGAVEIFDGPISQNLAARIEATANYTRFRFSGDRLHFLRANAQSWEILDLMTGEVRGAGPVGQGYGQAEISVSADGSMLFIGSINGHPARLLDVATGEEMQQFGDAVEGYFGFDNRHLVAGREGTAAAQVWRVNPALAD